MRWWWYMKAICKWARDVARMGYVLCLVVSGRWWDGIVWILLQGISMTEKLRAWRRWMTLVFVFYFETLGLFTRFFPQKETIWPKRVDLGLYCLFAFTLLHTTFDHGMKLRDGKDSWGSMQQARFYYSTLCYSSGIKPAFAQPFCFSHTLASCSLVHHTFIAWLTVLKSWINPMTWYMLITSKLALSRVLSRP